MPAGPIPPRRYHGTVTPDPARAGRDASRIADEVTYLSNLEKSFGHGEVHVNFTPWPDDEVYPRKYAAEDAMMQNYINNKPSRRAKYFLGKVKRQVLNPVIARALPEARTA